MKISCVLTAQQIGKEPADLIVFPEGICRSEIQIACTANPDSIIVGTVLENSTNRGVLIHQHRNEIDYLKISIDGRTTGCNNTNQNPIYEMDDSCIGVMICMDVNVPSFSNKVINQIKSSNCAFKILCVPADMGSYWFVDNLLPPQYEGIQVVLCNHATTYQFPARCQSFISNQSRNKIALQIKHEPLHFNFSSTII